jgi:CBS domain-containing protein/lysophospholipase L1-like esterase
MRFLLDLLSPRTLTMALPLGWSALALGRQTMLLRDARRRGQRLARAARAFEAAPPHGSQRVLLLGDSTGVGVGAVQPQHSLPGFLHQAFPHAHIVNRCRNGARVADALHQARQACARGERFDVALILVGGNDVLKLTPHARLEHDARALLRTLRACTTHIAWLGSADIGGAPVLLPPLNWLASWHTARTMRHLADSAAGQGVPFIDFSRDRRFARDTGTYFAADGIHPSSASYRLCFEELCRRVPLAHWLGGVNTRSRAMPTVSEIMSRPVQSVEPQETLRRAAEILRELDVGSLPVCQEHRLLGIVTDRDITVRGVACGLSPDNACVSDVMSPKVVSCRPDDDVQQAMGTMSREQLRRLPVVDRDERVVGILALADVALHEREQVDETVQRIAEP